MRLGPCLLSLSLLSLLAAQEPPIPPGVSAPSPQPEAKSEDQCTVQGAVHNARTGQPLARAQVRLVRLDGGGPPSNAVITDASGKFKLTGIPPGRYRVTATRTGFLRPLSKSGQPSPPMTLAPGQSVDNLTVEMVPAGVISGHVVDEYGEPLANVQLQQFRYVDMQGERRLMPTGRSTSTDDLGAYRMFGLDAGRYYVSAAYSETAASAGANGLTPPMPPMAGPPPAPPDESYQAVFYPGVADPDQAAPIRLGAGEDRQGVDFRLALVRSIRLRGHVASIPSGPQQVFVMLTPRGSWGAASFSLGPRPPVRVDAGGAFEIPGVTPGSYLLAAVVNRDGGPLWARLPVEAGSANIDGLELTFRPNVDLKGRARFEGDPQPSPDLTTLTAILTPLPASMGFANLTRSGLDAEGSFHLRNVTPGDYHLSVGPLAGDTYLKTVKYGGADVTTKPVAIGEAPGTFEVVLSAGGARVEGVVTDDGNPVVGAVVTALPDSGPAGLRKQAHTDRNGRFTLRHAPGDYTVYACASAPDGLTPDPRDLDGFQDKAGKVTVEEKARATADLTLIHIPGE